MNDRNLYLNFLKNKRIVVVGPAPTILGSKQRELIDGYDVVVRLNKALPLKAGLLDDVGTRTDVLYNCMNPSPECGDKIDEEMLHENGVKFLVSPYPPLRNAKYRFKRDIDFFLKKRKGIVKFCWMDEHYFERLMRIMQVPNTGICAILDILTVDIKELYITGFTFFKGGYIKEYRPYNEQQVLAKMAKHNLHNQEKQFRYMKDKLLGDSRVKMDQGLIDILNQDVSFKIDNKDKSLHKSNNGRNDRNGRNYRNFRNTGGARGTSWTGTSGTRKRIGTARYTKVKKEKTQTQTSSGE
jgi:hypothetical protein